MNQPLRPTWLEIDLGAIANNTRLLRRRTARGARLMAVVKADAYGHGALQAARTALDAGASWLGVAIPEEGVLLREAGLGAPILVLGGIDPGAARAVAAYGLSQAVFDLRTVRALAQAASTEEARVDVHIKVDTGMGRIGVRDLPALRALAEAIEAEPSLRLAGVFTHFAAADAEDLDYLRQQHARFLTFVDVLRRGRPDILVHAANSAALLRRPETHHDLVRAGIALYVDPVFPDGASDGLRPAMRWLTHAVHVKEIAVGESVGYGRHFVADRPTRVMTIPVGYADGYHRAIGGVGRALVRGHSVPVIGRVCMDQAMLDVTDVPAAAVGDRVVLLGAQGGERITAREWGGWCGMIDYEAVLSPTARVPRVYA